jgi:hypothetical protein
VTSVIALVHSPLVGHSVWGHVGTVLRRNGHRVTVPSLPGVVTGGPIWRGQVAVVASVDEPTALVAHSGAGPLMPAVVDAVPGSPPVVLVDAALPHPGVSRLDDMPDDPAHRLRALESHGHLPRWHEWFPEEALRRLIPDDTLWGELVASCPDLSLDLMTEPMPDAPDLDPAATSYVRLSAAYDAAADRADSLGWATRRLDLHHLALLTHPAEVAEAVEQAIQALG